MNSAQLLSNTALIMLERILFAASLMSGVVFAISEISYAAAAAVNQAAARPKSKF
jgi:hypothetical protein